MNSQKTRHLTMLWLIVACSIPRSLLAKADIKYTACVQVDACRAHFSAGMKLFKSEAFSDALREFNNAYAEQPDPRLLLNIGRTLHLLGKSQEALKYYQRCQEATAQDESLDHELSERLKDYIAQAQQAGVSSPSLPPSAEAPMTADTVSVQPTPPLTQPADSIPQVAPSPQALQTPLACKDTSPPVYKRWWLWALVGTSAAGIGLGLGLGLARRDVGMDPAIGTPSNLKVYTPTLTF